MNDSAVMHELIALYRSFGLAVAVIKPGDKLPRYQGWNLQSCEPEDFELGSNVGILTGALSGNLVCIDIDALPVLALADQYLPATDNIEGRPGKPASHRYYQVVDIPLELTAPPTSASGKLLGGPRTLQFRHPDGHMLLEILGTGRHAVAPPSGHPSGEPRVWEKFKEPAILKCADLYAAVARLATAGGWRPRAAALPVGPMVGVMEGERLYHEGLPDMEERLRRAEAYIARVPGAVSGQGGSSATFRVACLLVRDFALDLESAWDVLLEYNLRCVGPWSAGELQHKLADADNFAGARGQRLFWERADEP